MPDLGLSETSDERTLLLVDGPWDGKTVTVTCAVGDQIAAPFGQGETVYRVLGATAEFEGFRQR